MMSFQVSIIFLAILQISHEANILGIVAIPSKSHSIVLHSLMSTLAERGHNVTYVNCFPLNKKVPNLREITLPFTMDNALKNNKIDLFQRRHQSYWNFLVSTPAFGITVSESQIKTKEFQDLIKPGEEFDLIIGGYFVSESILAGLMERFKAPLIGFSPISPNVWTNFVTGNVAPTSFISDPFLGFPEKMNFWQRIGNFLYITLANLIHEYYYLPKQDEIYHKYFGEDAAPMIEHLYNTSVMFTNDHYSLSYPRPMVPNVISVGGLHVGAPKKLPENLQLLLDSSNDGVILFSMGSNLKSSDMPQEKIEIFLNVFGRMKQNVLWKFETDLPSKPENVMISNWLPQSDILAHPNTKMFITHGGLMSTIESIVRGVPVLGIPIFGDQPVNMRQAANAGVGLALQYDYIDEDTLENAINELLSNPKYRNAVKTRSKLLNDQPMSPMETAIFWTEYVLRHGDTSHLKSQLLHMPWYEAYQVDVILFVAIVIICCTAVLYLTLKLLFSTLKSKMSGNQNYKKVQ